MECPLLNGLEQECKDRIEVYPSQLSNDIVNLCTTDDYVQCPFYKILKTKDKVCKNIMKCPAFRNFEVMEFDKFIEISNEYCTSENHVNCKRCILKAKGLEVPITLHPNGEHIESWKK